MGVVKTSSTDPFAKKSTGYIRPTGKTELWNPEFTSSILKVNPNSKLTPPAVFEEGDDTKQAENMQAEVGKKTNIYGKRDWSLPKYQTEFRQRHKWFFDKPENKDWNPSSKEDVGRFQDAYNEKATSLGLSPYFISDDIINAEKDPVKQQQLRKFRRDQLYGDVTFAPPNLEELTSEEKAEKVKASKGPERQEPGAYTRGRVDAPWWIQDVINTASAAGTRAGLKKYLPWAPQVELQTPRPTFYDPTRELAQNTEQMAIGTEGAGMFAGPQAFSSRFAGIQGQGAKNAANILANYHNKNVGVANQFENIRTDIYNKNNMMNAQVAQKLYDGTTIANQQFDNAKRQANAELRGAYTNALTNRAMTQTMNTMYPNFQVDPMSGGMLNFYKGSPVDPTESDSMINKINALTSQGWSREDALKFYGYGDKQDRGTQVNVNQNPAYAAYMMQLQKMGQPQFGYNPNEQD